MSERRRFTKLEDFFKCPRCGFIRDRIGWGLCESCKPVVAKQARERRARKRAEREEA